MKYRIGILVAVLLLLAAVNTSEAQSQPPAVTVAHENFHGWDAVILRNRIAEVIVVPAIGRIMQFHFILSNSQPAKEEVFWNNPALNPQLPPDTEGWINYGGDKTWPAPQSNWPKTDDKNWPPPKTFDSMPYTVFIDGDQVELLSAVDLVYGVRVRRTLRLDAQEPVLTIKTTYEKVQGAPVSISVWTIAQVTMPEMAFILLPPQSIFPHGYTNMLSSVQDRLKKDRRILSFTPQQKNNAMIGSDGSTLLWVGTDSDLLLENKTAMLPGMQWQWPDGGLRSKIYTNAALGYMELELFTPLSELKLGRSISMASRYTLLRRTESDAMREAKKIFAASN